MDTETACKFIDYTCGKLRIIKKPTLLAWDSHRSHISSETKKYYRKLGVQACVIPGGIYDRDNNNIGFFYRLSICNFF